MKHKLRKLVGLSFVRIPINFSAMQKKLFMFVVMLLAMPFLGPLSAEAANHYVRSGASGSANGNDWTNAYTSLPSSLIRGDTYYIAAGSYGSYIFDDATSGTTLITIKKATVADHGTSTGWSDSHASGQAIFTKWDIRASYLLIDGQTGGGPGQWETGFGIKVSNSATLINNGFSDPSVSNVTFRHIELEGGGIQGPPYYTLVYWMAGASDINMSYMYIHDCPCDIFQIRNNFTRFTLEYSKVARNNQSAACHGDVFEYGQGSALNWVHRYNFFKDVQGTYLWGAHGYTNTYFSGAEIYGNIVDGGQMDNGLISAMSSGGEIVDLKFYNNTVANLVGVSNSCIGSYIRGSNNVAYNNIFYNNSQCFLSITHDYNWFYGSGSQSETHIQNGSVNPFANISAGNFTLIGAMNAGTPLGSTYNKDMNSNTRGADGAWDRGAMEYNSTIITTRPSPPSNLSINTL